MARNQEEEPLMIGPILLKQTTPLSIYATLIDLIQEEVKRINKKYTTEVNFGTNALTQATAGSIATCKPSRAVSSGWRSMN